MVKSYSAHLFTFSFLHVAIMLGSWQLATNESVRNEVLKLGKGGAIQLQAAGSLIAKSIPLQMKAPESVLRKSALKVPVKKELVQKKTEVAEKPTSGVVADSASGSGASGDGGAANGSEFGTSSKGVTDALSVYKAELRSVIDKNKFYPTMSKRLGHTGTVVVAFTLMSDGAITDVRVDSPSKYEGLNHSAVDAVKKIGKFKPIPKELGMAKMDVKVPVKFLTI